MNFNNKYIVYSPSINRIEVADRISPLHIPLTARSNTSLYIDDTFYVTETAEDPYLRKIDKGGEVLAKWIIDSKFKDSDEIYKIALVSDDVKIFRNDSKKGGDYIHLAKWVSLCTIRPYKQEGTSYWTPLITNKLDLTTSKIQRAVISDDKFKTKKETLIHIGEMIQLAKMKALELCDKEVMDRVL